MSPAFPAPPAFAFGPITRSDLVRYAGASGDFNPLHHDEEFARAAGLPGVMAHGMFSAGLLASFLSAWAGERQVKRFRVRFLAPVWPGDTLAAQGRVIGLGANAGSRLELGLSLHNQNGAEVVSGTAEVELADAGQP